MPSIPNTEASGASLLLPDAVSPAFLHTLPYPDIPVFPTETKESSCQKLLFSATLTRDPGKIAALNLRNPKYFVIQGSQEKATADGVLDIVMEKYSMPSTLTVRPTYLTLPSFILISHLPRLGAYDRL